LRNIVTIEGEVIANVRVAEEAERTLGNVPAGYTAVLRRIPKDSLQPEDIAFVREEESRALSVDTDGDGVADRTHTANEFQEQERAQENLLTMMPLLTPLQHLERGGQEIMARFGPLQALLEGMAKGKPTEQAVQSAKEYARSLLSIYNRSRLLHESQKIREVIATLRALPRGVVTNDLERALLATEKQLSVVDQILGSGAIPRMCEAISKLRPDTWGTWWEREGIIIVAAVGGAVLVASGIGAPIAARTRSEGPPRCRGIRSARAHERHVRRRRVRGNGGREDDLS
jgi:hypothetical protein